MPFFCPSVLLSVRSCIVSERLTILIFSFSGSQTSLVFPYQTLWKEAYYDKDPRNGGFERKGMKNCDFRPISRFISETIQDRARVTETLMTSAAHTVV